MRPAPPKGEEEEEEEERCRRNAFAQGEAREKAIYWAILFTHV